MNTINIDDEDFQTMLICAIRYSLGRRTYMPHLVIDYITPLIKYLSDKTLNIIERDIREAENMGIGYGDEQIDKPKWLTFHQNIQEEINKRKE